LKSALGDFNAKLEREDIFKPAFGNESLTQESNDNGGRIVKFATSENLVVKSTMFLHRNIYKHTWTSPDGKTHNRVDHVMIDKEMPIQYTRCTSFRGGDCDTGGCKSERKTGSKETSSTQV
jgi:hypothetical protein